MVRAWRIVKEKHAPTAFEGEGAWRHGGRWNSKGTRVVYTSDSKALAALENLVHLNPPVVFKYGAIPVDFPEGLVEALSSKDLPEGWAEQPPPPSAQAIGDRWVKEGRSAVLRVPSVLVPGEWNYLLNPGHPGFKKVVIGKSEGFSFDPRLV